MGISPGNSFWKKEKTPARGGTYLFWKETWHSFTNLSGHLKGWDESSDNEGSIVSKIFWDYLDVHVLGPLFKLWFPLRHQSWVRLSNATTLSKPPCSVFCIYFGTFNWLYEDGWPNMTWKTDFKIKPCSFFFPCLLCDGIFKSCLLLSSAPLWKHTTFSLPICLMVI